MGKPEGDNRVALLAGLIFMVILAWFPPFGIVIAGFLTGIISAKAKEGAILGGLIAAVGALIQITLVAKIVPLIGLGLTVLGIIPLSLGGILNAFGPFADIFTGLGGFLLGINFAQGAAVFILYCLLGTIGGFLGGAVRK